MRILVTGSTGFIGRHVLDRLAGTGHQIVAAARSRVKAEVFPWFNSVKFIRFDLNHLPPAPYEFFEKPDCLIHLSWEGLPNYKAAFHLERNYPQQAEFLKQMVAGGLKSLTVTGTCLEYGLQTGCLAEDSSSRPQLPYAQAKWRLYQDLEALQNLHAFGFKWVRLFYTYGPGQNGNAILSQLDKALEQGETSFNMSGGEQVRDYLPVEAMAEFIVKIALQDKVQGIINCCSGKPVTIKKLVEDHLVSKKRSIRLNLGFYPYVDYEPMSFWGDTRKLTEALHG